MLVKSSTQKVLVEAILKKNYLTQLELDRYATEAKLAKENLHSYLTRYDIVSERQIMESMAEYLNMESVDLKRIVIDKQVIDRVPVKFTSYYKFIPIQIQDNSVKIATAMPMDIRLQDEIRVHLGLEPTVVLAIESDIYDALKRYYGLASDTIDRILTRDPDKRNSQESDQSQWVEDIERKSEDPSVAKLVNQIIFEAYQKRATDIHIEPYRNKVRLRYRIDGVLVDANLPNEAKVFLLPIISRIKIMSNLSITEKRLPQDGSTVVRTKDQDLDLRVSTIPTPRGESMVIRILPTKTMLMSLEKLGFNAETALRFRHLIGRPHGIIFVTGPTGSGKTTTLYACLNEINTPGRKIITIEDPVEYEMEGITQIQVNTKVELDFAKGLRSVLRHDPDILMVGEVRDLETAEIAIRTALTGHMVFSTLHTNDAASGVTRLIDMGIEPYLVASSVEAFVAQRLVRIICSDCKAEDSNPLKDIRDEIQKSLQMKDSQDIKIYKGNGCDRCNGTGYYGRAAIYEIMEFNEAIRAAIIEKPRAEYIKRIAVQNGMLTLRQDGWKNVLSGITTPAEILNVTTKEQVFYSSELFSLGSNP
jgi:type II secretory ATPase GspE/PulE/Tfp pilus assembly ATPase PilB-like protein